MAAIVDFLGGTKGLGASPKTAVDWERIIVKGMPFRSAEALKEHVAVPDALLAELLGISEKTLSRARAARVRLDPVVSDRLFRVARIIALAVEVLESEEAALHWLKRSQIGLGGRSPLPMLATEAGRDQVEKLLLRIEYGVYT
ncbi:MAG TPA: antitoxin Xre-like helix-turn-helix domain-containing protein [Burkholderiaceae bacterium]|nr:antitoxin Xre-like helix-turn-helix domain-containing protein [Burkholderiaceae bacterium]